MILLLLLACVQTVPEADTIALSLDQDQILFAAEVGACDAQTLTLSNTGTVDLEQILVSGPMDTCAESPYSSVTTSLALSPGVEAGLAIRYCPTQPGSCASILSVDDGEGTSEEVSLVGVSTSPDADADSYRVSDGDCDDSDPEIFPGATELEDGLDNDCDSAVDEGTPSCDDDGDGWTERAGDCDDGDAAVFPGALEIYNGRDDDCDGWVDNRTDAFDDDGDGYTEGDGDCDDLNPEIFPLANEFPDGYPNGVDDDCDGLIDETTP